ncbi:PQQ-binding-like beta-propeller repeat protein [Halomarina salina]|uniref:PQQ-binding-like beta-propeller repeat protein n=1 Tax=Halomarina salina TaxID=1872699 RepID=A0ABD5RTB0_9EURY|nr:PQQ-binding-like beta-propeller repeat protein [Halomarina salina]
MRLRTYGAVALVVVALSAVVFIGLGSPTSGTFTENWVSDTARENERNHHAVGASDGRDLVVAPVAEAGGDEAEYTDTSCTLARLAATNGSVAWRTSVPPDECFTHALTEPDIGDLDGNGNVSVVAATFGGDLVAYDARTGASEWSVPLVETAGERRSYGYGRPTIGELLPADGREVVVSDVNGNVVAVEADGNVAWRYSLSQAGMDGVTVSSRPLVGDVDGDGAAEVVVSSNDGVVVLDADGELLWERTLPASYLASGQADDDPQREIAVGYQTQVALLDGASGETEWSREADEAVRFREVADGDGDGAAELYVGYQNGTVGALDLATGRPEWTSTLASDSTVWAPTLGDGDGDGTDELFVPTQSGLVTAVDPADGSELAAYQREVPIWTHLTPADVDGDGRTEVFVRYGDGRVVSLTYDG